MFSMLFGLKDQWSVIDDPRWSKMIQDSPNAHRISSQSLGADPLDIQVHEGHSDPRPRAAHEGHWVSLKLLRHSRWKHKDTKRWIQANHKSHKTIDLLISFNLLFPQSYDYTVRQFQLVSEPNSPSNWSQAWVASSYSASSSRDPRKVQERRSVQKKQDKER